MCIATGATGGRKNVKETPTTKWSNVYLLRTCRKPFSNKPTYNRYFSSNKISCSINSRLYSFRKLSCWWCSLQKGSVALLLPEGYWHKKGKH
jgi:hypothetical protein